MTQIISPSAAALWNEINQSRLDLPMLDADFFALLLTHFGRGDERCLSLDATGGNAFVALVRQRNAFQWETFQPSQAPIGPCLLRGDWTLPEAATAMFTLLPGVPLSLGILQQDPLQTERPVQTACIEPMDYIETGSFTVAGDFEEYWNNRGTNLKQNIKKQLSRIEKEGRRLVPRIIEHPSDMAAAVREYASLEAKGWKAKSGTSLVPGNAQEKFYAALMNAYAARKEALVLQLWLDERLVSSDLCLRRRNVLTILKTTYDEDEKRLSAALVMRRLSLGVICGKTNAPLRIEFYGPMMDWHSKWTDSTRKIYHVNVDRNLPVAVIRRSLRRLRHQRPIPTP